MEAAASSHPRDLLAQPALLNEVLARMGLASAGADAVVEPLTGGVSSSIFRVIVDGRTYCLKQALPKLKVAKDWEAPVDRVFSEVAWLKTAHRIVPGHVPKVLGVDRDCGAFAMQYLPAADHRNWKSELLAGKVNPAVATTVGTVLGRLHAHTAADATTLAPRFATDANFFALRLEPYLIESARQQPARARELVALVYETQHHPLALVHGDVSPKNILLGPQGPVLLDAECAWWGDPAFDLAFVLNHMLLKLAHLPGNRLALRASFEALAAAYLPYVKWEPAAALEARCARLIPGLLLGRVDGKSPVEYLGEPVRKRVRDFALAALVAPANVLAALLAQWLEAFG